METFSALLPFVNSPVPAEFPTQRPVTRSFDIFFDLHPNKRLSKQWRGNRAHYDVTVKYHVVDIQLIIPHPWGNRLIRTRGSFSCLIIAWKVFEISLITMYCARIEIMIKSHHIELLPERHRSPREGTVESSAMGLLGLQIKVHHQCDQSHQRSKLETIGRPKTGPKTEIHISSNPSRCLAQLWGRAPECEVEQTTNKQNDPA